MSEPPAEPHVDLRFALANERTLLAWIRTALALLAAGGAVQQFSDVPAKRPLGLLIGAVGVVAAVAGGVRFARTAAALRAGRASVSVVFPVTMAAAVAVLGLLLLGVLAGAA